LFATLLGAYPPDPAATSADEAVRDAIAEQERAGLEPVTDGRGALAAGPDAVAAWKLASGSAGRAVKQALVGPMTEARATGEDPSSAADRLRETIDALVDAGCPLVEIDEPEVVRLGDEPAAMSAFVESHRRLTAALDGSIHLSLTVTGGNAPESAAGAIFDLPYASYAFDLIAGPDNWRLIALAPSDRGIICGALDPSAAADDRPEILIWAAHYAASTGGRGLARVGLANASALDRLTPERARAKVHALGEAARLAAVESPDELAAALDPRAVDIRSAALGRFSPSAPATRRPRR